MDARPLRDLLADLVGDASARQAYGADPAGYLAAHGHPDLPEQLVAEAVVSYADTAPVEVAEALAPYVSGHGPVPVPEAHGDWFELLTSADVADDDPFGEQFDVVETPGEWTDPAELDFGAGAPSVDDGDHGAMADDAPDDTADDLPDDGQAPVTEPDWPVDAAPEPPIAGLPDEDDDPGDDDTDE